MNQAITPDAPQVTGTVTAYTVSPALPTGLSLNANSGTISGTPTAVSSAASYTITAANSAGSAVTRVQIAVNSAQAQQPSFAYPQTVIRAYVGQAIAADTPVVNGGLTDFGPSGEAPPPGLKLDPATGTISGTPTAPEPLATYTIAAPIATGFVTATVQIVAAEPNATAQTPVAPTGLQYPQTTIATWVGREITPDVPATAGAITSYAVAPELPPGLTLNPSTGVITGTPIATSPQANYTIVGSNAAGEVSATISLTVNDAPIVLEQLGNQYVNNVQFAGSSVLSQGAGTWMLRNYSSGALIASGDYAHGYTSIEDDFYPQLAQMAGPTLAIGIPGGIEVRSAADGHLVSVIVLPGYQIDPGTNKPEELNRWQLASDGSYIAVETYAGLYAFAPTGQLLCFESGNYILPATPTAIFAAPGQIQIANGWAGPSAIETFSVPGGVSTVSSPYQGSFYGWFADGTRFITQTGYLDFNGDPVNPAPGSTVWVYSTAGAQQAAVQLPFFYSIGGWGNWLWLWGYSNEKNTPDAVVYAVGSSTPVLTDPTPDVYVNSSGSSLASVGVNTVGIIDLSGSQPVETEYTLPSDPSGNDPYPLGDYAAQSANKWVAMCVTNEGMDMLLDGPSLATGNPRYLGNGAATSIAGSASNVAIATAVGQVSWFSPYNPVAQGSLSLTSAQIELSSDGSLLGVAAVTGQPLDEALNFYTLPSGELTQSFNYPTGLTDSFSYALSGSGATVATNLISVNTASSYYTLTVNPVSGSPTILSISNSGNNLSGGTPAVISPDGTLVAATIITNDVYTITIFKNGASVATVPGMAIGWIDNGRLLAATTQLDFDPSGATIYSPTGAVLGTPPLPAIGAFQTVSSDVIYVPALNAMYSLTTGQQTWSSPYPADEDGPYNGPAAVAGSNVVFESEGKVISVPY